MSLINFNYPFELKPGRFRTLAKVSGEPATVDALSRKIPDLSPSTIRLHLEFLAFKGLIVQDGKSSRTASFEISKTRPLEEIEKKLLDDIIKWCFNGSEKDLLEGLIYCIKAREKQLNPKVDSLLKVRHELVSEHNIAGIYLNEIPLLNLLRNKEMRGKDIEAAFSGRLDRTKPMRAPLSTLSTVGLLTKGTSITPYTYKCASEEVYLDAIKVFLKGLGESYFGSLDRLIENAISYYESSSAKAEIHPLYLEIQRLHHETAPMFL